SALRAEATRLQGGIDRERLVADVLRQGLLSRPGLTDVPDGQLFVESLRAQIRGCREPLVRSLEDDADRRAAEEAERRLAACRSEADRAAGRLEELQRRRRGASEK